MTNKEGYRLMKSLGLCVRCNKRRAVQGKVSCEICAARESEYRHRRWMAMPEEKKRLMRDKENKYRARVREERKKQGLCPRCGKPKAHDYILCTECNLRSRRDLRKSRERKRERDGMGWKNGIERYEYPLYGICCKCCKNPVIEGKKLCADCMEKMPVATHGNAAWKEYYKRENQLLFKRF